MYQARHSMWCAVIQYLGCLQREKRLFTCRHACRSLTTLTHPASTLATLIKTKLCQAESEWYGVNVFPLPALRKECQKHVYLLMLSSGSKTWHSCHIYSFRFSRHAQRKPDLPIHTNRVGRNRPEKVVPKIKVHILRSSYAYAFKSV